MENWCLHKLISVPHSARTFRHPQFWCAPDGRTRSRSDYDSLSAYDCGYNANQEFLQPQHQQCCHFRTASLTADMLMQKWGEQWDRLQVPCANPFIRDSANYMWFRNGKIITLGELFMVLGRVYTAASIYAFYRTLRIVVLKRCKARSYMPGSTSACTGLSAGPLQASIIKHSLLYSNKTAKRYFVEEYCEARGLEHQPITKQILDAAVRHMHKILLCDLNPPWLEYQFPQALPGDGVLSRLTRPSFLQWINDGQDMTRFFYSEMN